MSISCLPSIEAALGALLPPAGCCCCCCCCPRSSSLLFPLLSPAAAPPPAAAEVDAPAARCELPAAAAADGPADGPAAAPLLLAAPALAGSRPRALGCSLKPNTRGTYVSAAGGGRSDGYVISSRCGKVVPK